MAGVLMPLEAADAAQCLYAAMLDAATRASPEAGSIFAANTPVARAVRLAWYATDNRRKRKAAVGTNLAVMSPWLSRQCSTDVGVREWLRYILAEDMVVHPRPTVRSAAVQLMHLLLNPDERAQPGGADGDWFVAATWTLHIDPDRHVRLASLAALGTIGASAANVDVCERAALALQMFAEDPAPEVRIALLRLYRDVAATAQPTFRNECMRAWPLGPSEPSVRGSRMAACRSVLNEFP